MDALLAADWTIAPALAVALFLVMLALINVGFQWRQRRRAAGYEGGGLGAVEGAVFGLMGLVLAFSFSGAAARFDQRRALIVQETNDIGTAYLRIDLLPAGDRPAIREKFRQYLDARLDGYAAIPDMARVNAAIARAQALQDEIWRDSLGAIDRAASPPVAAQLIPALNAMFDIASTRIAATEIHQPGIIFLMLGGLALACSLLAGYAMGAGTERNWLHIIAFALIISATIYIIGDLEFPRVGFIRVDQTDHLLRDLRQSMK